MHRVIASWFGTGLILRRIRGSDSGSGTVGSIFAAVVAFAFYQAVSWPWQLAATAVLIIASFLSIRPLVAKEGDAGWIVIDEAAGTFLALIGLELWPGAVVAFVVFRAADIFKGAFPGVAAADRASGAAGVTADDIVAGLYGLAAGHLVQALV